MHSERGFDPAVHMAFYDIFNGDADGICALHQLRLHEPRTSLLVTGVKRKIRLVERVQAAVGDELTVLDVSFEVNRAGVLKALKAGARSLQLVFFGIERTFILGDLLAGPCGDADLRS